MSVLREYITNPDLRGHALLVLATGLVIGMTCAALSPLVVLRRLGLTGQGVSHSAFGGVGVASVLGLTSGGTLGLAGTLIVGAFCVLVSVGIGELSARRERDADTPIAVFLAASMALGFVLLELARRGRSGGGGSISLESVLFGQVWGASGADLMVAAAFGALAIGALVLWRRPLLFWAFDEPVARASGVRTGAMRVLLMALLGLTVFIATKLTGVVLATALLVLPGATALRLSRRAVRVLVLSECVVVACLLVAFGVSLQLDLPTGPTIALTLTAAYALASLRGRRAPA